MHLCKFQEVENVVGESSASAGPSASQVSIYLASQPGSY